MTSTPVHSSTRLTEIALHVDLTERFPVAPTRNIKRPVVKKHEPRTTDGIKHPVTVKRINWTEDRLSDCPSGCKVYTATVAGRVVEKVMHHPVYGCNL